MDKFLPLPLPWHSQSNSHPPNPTTLTPQSSLHSIPSLDSDAIDAVPQVRCIATLQGHSSYIFSLAVSGKDLYSGAADGEIRVWTRIHPNSINFSYDYGYTVGEGYSAVKSIAFAGDKVITAHQDHKIRVWRGEYGKYRMIATLPTVNDRCLRIFSAKNYVQVRRHNKRTWVHHVDAVSSVAVTDDGEFLYSVSWDRTMKVWRTSDFKCVESVQNAHDDAINAVVLFSGAGYCAFTCSADKKIKLWKKRAGEKTHSLKSTMEKHKSAVNALALAGDGGVLYSGACDRSIIVWESEGSGGNWTAAIALKGHKKAVLCLAVVGELLCSGSADRTVRIWRRKYGCMAVLEGHTCPVKCLTAVDLDGKGMMDSGGLRSSVVVYSGGLDFEIRVWQIEI